MTSISSSTLSLFTSITANSGTTDLLSVIYGGGSAGSGVDPVSALISAETNQTKDIAQQENVPQTKLETNHFLAVVAKATDLKTVLADPIARKVLLTANGLGDQTDYVALATKALSSDTTQTGNLASQLTDTRWLSMAKTYDFANKGLSVLKTPSVLSSLTSGYAEVQWRESLDASTPGLSAALDFRARASTMTNVDQILGDTNIRKVVTTALGLPQEIAYQPLSTQEKAITDRLDITKFQDPAYVEQFARRFLVTNNMNSTNSSSSAASLLLA